MKTSLVLRNAIAILVFALSSTYGFSQVYPVQSTPQLVPPYSVYLSDYASPGNEKLRVILIQRDLTQPSYQLRLVMSVELNGKIIMRTAQSFRPPPITLSPGIPTTISGAELAPYLDSRNIDFVGYSREQYEKTKALPEGSYQLIFTAYDFQRQDVQVSNAGGAFYYLMKSEPPLINFPACGSKIPLRTPQQIIFSWLPRNTASPNSAAETEYELSIYEIRPAGRNPNDIVQTLPPVFTAVTDLTQYIYGPGDPMLLDYMTYAWRVRAIDKSGRDAFRNNGFSEVCTFTIGVGDGVVIGNIKDFDAEAETELLGRAWWTTGDFDAYRVHYRKVGKDYEWFTVQVTAAEIAKANKSEAKLFDLEPDTQYEARVQGKKAAAYGGYSDIVKFRTPPHKPAACGVDEELPFGDMSKPIGLLLPGFIIQIDDMRALLKTVTPLGDGYFSGTGYIGVDFLGKAPFPIKFDRLFIDEDRVAGEGRVDYITQGTAQLIERQAANAAKNKQQRTQQENRDTWADTEFYEDIFLYDVLIDTITVEGLGYINITDSEGNISVNAEITQVLLAYPNKAIIIQDKSGNQYVVQKDQATGKVGVTKVPGGGLVVGSDGKILSGKQLRKLDRMILASLRTYKKAIEDYQASIKNGSQKGKGGGPSLFEWELEMFYADLPQCLSEHKEELGDISTRINIYLDSASAESSAFRSLIADAIAREFATPEARDNASQERIDTEVCSALTSAIQIDVPSERTYITPAGTLIKLPSNHQVNNICIDQTLYPNGALLNFTVGAKIYYAKIKASGTPAFEGYFEIVNKEYSEPYNDGNQYTSTKTDVSFIERVTDVNGGTAEGKIFIGEYHVTDTRTNQQIVSSGGIPLVFFSLPQAKPNTSAVSISFGDCPASALDDYIKSGRLQKWLSSKGLKADVYLSDCVTGKTTHITDEGTATASNTSAKQQYDNGSFSSDIAVWACWDGKQWKVEHKYKPGAIKPTHAKIKADLTEINKEIDRRIDKLINDANTGNGKSKADVTYDYGEDGQVHIEGMDFLEAIIAVKDFSKTLVNYARIPDQTWDSKNKAGEYGKYPVHVPPMLAGAGDQTLEEMTGALQFVNFGLDLATDPEIAKQTWEQISGLTPADVKKMIVGAAQSKADKYAEGGVIARHEAGKDVVVVAVTVVAAYKAITQAKKLITDSGAKVKELASKAGKLLDDIKLKSLTPEVPNGTFINSTKFKNSAMKIDPSPDPRMKQLADDVKLNGDIDVPGGSKTEQIQDILYTDAGYTKLDGKVGSNQGLDGLYIKGDLKNPTEIIVAESKQWQSSGGIKLSDANPNTGLPVQMSDAWIQNVAIRLQQAGKREVADMLLNPAFQNKIAKYAIVVDKTTGGINILKLGTY